MAAKIAVIGAGVIGLTSAIRLLEKGFDVSIFARSHEPNMASRAAPALWLPYKASPEHLILEWAKKSWAIYQDFPAGNGVEKIELVEFYNQDNGDPLWSKILKNFQTIPTSQLPENYIKGYITQTYLIDSSVFVDYLQGWFKKLGGKIIEKDLKTITEVDTQFKTIINCSGVWSNQLVPDKNTFPIRGQYFLTEKPAGLTQILFATLDEDGYILVMPRTHDCYVGGTTNYYDWNTDVDAETSEAMWQRALLLVPALKNVKILKTSVGLRPGRKAVRLEAEKLADERTVIHNYGHGGSGFTVGWGCAEDVVNLCCDS